MSLLLDVEEKVGKSRHMDLNHLNFLLKQKQKQKQTHPKTKNKQNPKMLTSLHTAPAFV